MGILRSIIANHSQLMSRTVVLATVLSGLTAIDPLQAQDVRGNLTGLVATSDGRLLANVSVTVIGPSLQGIAQATTDARGFFRVMALPVGSYTVELRQVGYRPVDVQDVVVRLGKTTALGKFRLEDTPFELEPIVVVAEQAIIDPTSTILGGNLDQRTFEALPTGRDYQSIITLLPHVNPSFYGDAANIGGATGLENAWFIDGANVTDPFSAGGGTSLPYNFVKEIQVKEAGYQAEYGRGLGGIVNAVTHSGGNDFSAHAFGYFSNSALAGESQFGIVDATVDAFSSFDVGLGLGGPIVRDELWYYVAYNPSVDKKDVVIPGLGAHPDERTVHRFAGKLTWRPAQNTDLALSIFGDPTTHRRIGHLLTTSAALPSSLANPDPLLARLKQGGVNFSLLGRSQLSSRFVIEGALARHQNTQSQRGDTEFGRSEPLLIDFTNGGTWSGGYAIDQETKNTRTSVRVHGTWFLGNHTVKGGIQYEDNGTDIVESWGDPGFINRVPEAPWLDEDGLPTGDTLRYLTLIVPTEGLARSQVPTAFLQDSWRVTDRLTINAGLRWAGEWLIAAGDSVGQAITDEWQPRLGVIYQPGRLGSQKVFGSYGRYYQQLPTFGTTLNLGQEICTNFYDEDPRNPGAVPFDDDCTVALAARVDGLNGEQFDQFTLGYERLVGNSVKVAIRGVYRELRAAVGFGTPDGSEFIFGNLGEGDLDFLPKPERKYTALELSAEQTSGRLSFLVSYVLSRSYGNYTGLFNSDNGIAEPQNNFVLQLPEQARNSTGLLPNDRTHVFKVSGAYRFDFGLTAGTFFSWLSGTPLNQFGPTDVLFRSAYVVPRGSDGRTPSIWDLNFRLTYDMLGLGRTPLGGRLILDLLHVGSRQTMVWTDQNRFVGSALNPVENSTFGDPFRFQPPMTVRLGVEVYH